MHGVVRKNQKKRTVTAALEVLSRQVRQPICEIRAIWIVVEVGNVGGREVRLLVGWKVGSRLPRVIDRTYVCKALIVGAEAVHAQVPLAEIGRRVVRSLERLTDGGFV